MSVAPHAGIVDFGTFTSPSGVAAGIQGEVPAPLAAQAGYILATSGWILSPIPVSGSAQLDFGAGSTEAEVVVTGVPEVLLTSVVIAVMRIEATDDHSEDELLVDPIRIAVKSRVVGQGFTIYGAMDNARANGLFKVDWFLSN